MFADHPFWTGLAVSIGVFVPLRLLFPSAPHGAVRAVGLVAFGGALALLFRQGLDRDDAFWFFLGGALGAVIGFAATL